MLDYKVRIASMKKASFEEACDLALPVLNTEGRVIGSLVPIGNWILADDQKIQYISTWRNAAKKMFPTQVDTSYSSTLAYLTKSSVDNELGLLFAIFDENACFVGHIGVTDVRADQFELAHLIKGVEGADAKLIFNSEICLVDWCFRTFDGERAVVEIMSYNWIVSMLHKEIGFEVATIHPLKRVVGEVGITHQVVSRDEANVKYTMVRMGVSKKRFYQHLQDLSYNRHLIV